MIRIIQRSEAMLLLLAAIGSAPAVAQAPLFSDSGQALGSAHSRDVELGDLDGDGDLDAWIANTTFLVTGPNRVWINQGGAQGSAAGVFIDSGQDIGEGSSHSVALGDVDGDGDLDAFVGNIFNGTDAANRVWINDGAGSFTDSGQALGARTTFAVALGDLDGDGDLDAVVANADVDEPNTVYLNQGGIQGGAVGTFSENGSVGSAQARSVALTDIDADGDLDVALGVAFGASMANEVWINQGGLQAGAPGQMIDSGQRLGDQRTLALRALDADGDGDPDLFEANSGVAPQHVIWFNQGGAQGGTGGVFQSAPAGGSRPASDAVAADFDDDGDLDLHLTHFDQASGTANSVWLNDGTGAFSDAGVSLGNSSSQAAAAGDVDGDGDPDIVVANDNGSGGPEPNRLWLNVSASQPPQPQADLVLDAWPQGRFDSALGRPSDPLVTTMSLDISNLGPDPATDVTVDISGNQVTALGASFTCTGFGGDSTCTRPSLAVGSSAFLGLSSVRLRQLPGVYAGTTSISVVLLSNEPDPNPAGRAAGVTVDHFDCSSGCFMERLFCLLRFSRGATVAGPADVDLPVYYLLRRMMNTGTEGRRLVQRYASHQSEILSLVEQDAALMEQAQAVLGDWQPALAALATGGGEQVSITRSQVDSLDALLSNLEFAGSAALAQAIAEERALIGPFEDLVGLTMAAAAARVIPTDTLQINSFERPETLTD